LDGKKIIISTKGVKCHPSLHAIIHELSQRWNGVGVVNWLVVKGVTLYIIIPHQIKPFPLTNFHARETQSQHAIFN
jgi:hypothetical protein